MIVLTRKPKGQPKETLEFRTYREAVKAIFGFRDVSIRCDSCQACMTQGMFCHETGCPGAWADEKPECRECGCNFSPEHKGQDICLDCHASLEEDMNRDIDKANGRL